MLIAATAGLFALSYVKERSKASEEVISDTLLTRESIAFQVGRETEALQKLAADVGRHAQLDDDWRARFETFMRRAGQVLDLSIVDSELRLQFETLRGGAKEGLAQVPRGLLQSVVERVALVDHPVATAAFQGAQGPTIALVVPTAEAGTAPRFIVAVYSLDRLLEEMVPWDLAQDYELTLSDVTGALQARRAAAGPGRGVYRHQEPLDIGGTTLVLGLDSVRGALGWIASVLRAGIATLALLLLWSLWALWRDHRRRMAAERLAREEAALRRAIGDCCVIGVSARGLDGRVCYVNPAFSRMVGYDADEIVGRCPPAGAWLPPLEGEYRRHLQQWSADDAPYSAFETQLARRGGEVFPAAIYDAPLLDAAGRQIGWTSSIVDLTHPKQTEERERVQQERLQTAARLTTMGELTSTLAHELNQPLGAIAGYLAGSIAMLRHGEEDRADLVAVLVKASAQTQRAGQIIQRIHEFVRKQEPRREQVRFADVIGSCRALIELQAKRESIQVEVFANGASQVPVWADPVMLQQVVLNLTRNAADAMSSSPPERRRLILTVSADATGVRLSVRDFGQGVPEQDSERIFMPFFTTKAEGMGMGLSICRTIVQAHGGRLWLERHDGGTEFQLWLPRVE